MPDFRKIDKCRACQAPIVWAQTSTGKAMPVDAEPCAGGNVLLLPMVDRKWLALVDSGPGVRHKSHFATCSDAARFRKRVKSGGRK